MTSFEFPAEQIELPSRGWYYEPTNPLSSGFVNLKLMTAQSEDILSSRNLLVKGTVIDRLLESLIVDKNIKYGSLLVGDANALMIASRIYGYGKMYETTCECPQCTTKVPVSIDLEELKFKEIDFQEGQRGKNEFELELPICKTRITFRLMTQGDEEAARRELESMRRGVKSEITKEVTTRMRHSILSVDGDRDREKIRQFVDTMLSRDAQAFRDYARKINPDVDRFFDFECLKCGYEARQEVPISVDFFWIGTRV
jgi:hypothetical protein